MFNNQVKTAGDTEASQHAFAAQFAKSFVNTSNADLAKQVLVNMGVQDASLTEVQPLEAALAEYFGTVSKEDRGIVVLQLGTILSGLETATGDQAEYVPAAKAWNVEIERAYVYSSNPAHTTPQEGDDGAGSTALTRFTDVLSGSAFTGYLDYNQYTGYDEQTLTTGDRLTGTAGDTDTLFAQQLAGSRPTLSGIEVISIDAKAAAPTLDLSDSTGIKQVVNYRSSETSTLTFQGLKNLVDVEIDHTNANTVVNFNGSVVAGVNDNLNLNVKGAGVAAKPANFTVNGIENLAISATEDASVLGTVNAAITKLSITGDQDLRVGSKATSDAVAANATAAAAAKTAATTTNNEAVAFQTQLAALNANIANAINALDAGADGTIDAGDVAPLTAADIVGATGLSAASPIVTGALAAINATIVAGATVADVQAAAQAVFTPAVNNAAYLAAANLAAADAADAAAAAADAAMNLPGPPAVVVGPQGFTSANLSTVDAAEATGNLFLNLTASAARDQTVTTGKGNDVVVTGDLMATDTFNLGEGNDRIVLETVSTNEAAKLQGVEEVEARVANTNLNLVNAPDVKLLAVAQNAGFANVTAVKSGTSVVFEGAGLANAVSNSAVHFGNVKYNLANANGASDVIDFKFMNAGVALGANSTVNLGVLTNSGNNTETLNFTFSDVGATNTVTVTDIAGNAGVLKNLNVTSDSKVVLGGVADLTKLTSVDATGVKAGFTATFGALAETAAATIKLGGSGVNNVTVTKANDGVAGAALTSVKLLTVDGSAGTGNQVLTVTGNPDTTTAPAAANSGANATAKASVSVIGGSGNDTINVTTGANAVSLISGGAGSDTINLGNALDATAVDVIRLAAGDATGSLRDTVNGFRSGTDKFDLSAFGFDVALHGVTSAAAALNGSANEFAGKAVYVDSNANVLYVDVNGDNKFDAADLVVNVTGVAVAAGDILFV